MRLQRKYFLRIELQTSNS